MENENQQENRNETMNFSHNFLDEELISHAHLRQEMEALAHEVNCAYDEDREVSDAAYPHLDYLGFVGSIRLNGFRTRRSSFFLLQTNQKRSILVWTREDW